MKLLELAIFYHCPAPCVGLELSLRQQQQHFSGFFRGCFEADLRGKNNTLTAAIASQPS